VAIMAMVAACTLEPGIYLSMNIKGAGATEPAIALDTVARVQAAGFSVSVEQMRDLATQLGEKTLFGRTGGAATLAVGMAQIFSRAVSGRWLDLWYHFAIMFEALFILTTLDAGTRVGRYLLHDVLGNLWRPLGETKSIKANLVTSLLMVTCWGYFLIQGVRDPLGGINSLWPLFGIANQLLSAVALCLGTTIVLKMHLHDGNKPRLNRPIYALVTLIPLLWLLSATMTAGVQKIFHPKPTIGFLAKAESLNRELPALEMKVQAAVSSGGREVLEEARKAVRRNRIEHFNQVLDATVAGVFLSLVVLIVLLSIREWVLLLARKRLATLHETEPVWLPDYALAQARPLHMFSVFALAFALAKELSGEAEVERMQEHHACGETLSHDSLTGKPTPVVKPSLPQGPSDQKGRQKQLYLRMTEKRFTGVTRCC
jgi:carbon starvation protein